MSGVTDWLLDHSVHTIVTAVLTRAFILRGRVQVGVREGRTCQSPKVFKVSLLCGAMALVCLAWGILNPSTLREQSAAAAWLLLIVGFTLSFLSTGAYAQHVWSWNERGLTWRGAWRKTAIAWSDIEPAEKSWDGQFLARDAYGHAIRWTTFTLEH